MSSLLQIVRSQGIKNGLALLAKPKHVKPNNLIQRLVSSTPKKDDTSADQGVAVKKEWVSFGFDEDDKFTDRFLMHITLFVSVSICLVGGAFIMAYLPDPRYRDWARREAYLQLRYREENGLPQIDPNLVDPSKFTLPTDEELGDIEIII
ncbi:NADH dehydrogenase [ubiquinone] 1 beta subcomplex subunit NP15.6 [Halictus rubicundus]|uniref:NADH dehydrogenase [ubiquinone] 1 beta subcomplex subunit NP15.6 n=1 Tax=Halictus rubicundus TaxID=77578 RepID=UPI0040371632